MIKNQKFILLSNKIIDNAKFFFGDVTRPNKRNILPHKRHYFEIENIFKYKKWIDIPAYELFLDRAALSFVTPKGFQFFAPAFLIRGLEDIDNYGIEILENLFNSINISKINLNVLNQLSLGDDEVNALTQYANSSNYKNKVETRLSQCDNDQISVLKEFSELYKDYIADNDSEVPRD